MAAIDFGLNGRPRSFRKPFSASSADMARRLSFPPLGFLRASAFASLTTSGRASIWLLRPSTFSPVTIRLRLRAAAYLATRVVFSNSATAPKHLADEDRRRCVLDEVRGRRRCDERDSLRLEQVVARKLHHEVASEAVRALHDNRPRAVAHQALQLRLSAVQQQPDARGHRLSEGC